MARIAVGRCAIRNAAASMTKETAMRRTHGGSNKDTGHFGAIKATAIVYAVGAVALVVGLSVHAPEGFDSAEYGFSRIDPARDDVPVIAVDAPWTMASTTRGPLVVATAPAASPAPDFSAVESLSKSAPAEAPVATF
jgi:hypothetical protein